MKDLTGTRKGEKSVKVVMLRNSRMSGVPLTKGEVYKVPLDEAYNLAYAGKARLAKEEDEKAAEAKRAEEAKKAK